MYVYGCLFSLVSLLQFNHRKKTKIKGVTENGFSILGELFESVEHLVSNDGLDFKISQ